MARTISNIEKKSSSEQVNISASNTKTDEIISVLDSQSLFSQRRTIVIKDCQKLQTKEIEKILEHYSQSDTEDELIFCSHELDKKSPIINLFTKKGSVRDCQFKTGYQLKRSIEEIFSKACLRVETSVIDTLMSISLSDPGRSFELAEQIALYASGSDLLISAELEDFVGSSSEGNLFKMIDALFSGKKKIVYETFERLVNRGEAPSKMLFTIVRHLKILLALNGIKKRDEISNTAKRFNVPGFAVENYLRQSRRFSKTSLVKAINLAQKVDWQLKGGGSLSDSQTMELLLAEILNLA